MPDLSKFEVGWEDQTQRIRAWVSGDIKLLAVVMNGNVAMFTTRGNDAREVLADHAHGDPLEFKSEEEAIAYAEGFAAMWLHAPKMLEPCACLPRAPTIDERAKAEEPMQAAINEAVERVRRATHLVRAGDVRPGDVILLEDDSARVVRFADGSSTTRGCVLIGFEAGPMARTFHADLHFRVVSRGTQ